MSGVRWQKDLGILGKYANSALLLSKVLILALFPESSGTWTTRNLRLHDVCNGPLANRLPAPPCNQIKRYRDEDF